MMKILYFAALRERMGRTEEDVAPPPPRRPRAPQIAPPPHPAHLQHRDPAGAAAFAHPTLVRAAVNQEFAHPRTAIRDGDEIAFFPPVTGG